MKLPFLRSKKSAPGSEDSDSPVPHSLPSRDEDSGDGQFRQKLLMGVQQFGFWFQIHAQPVLRKFDWELIRTLTLILALSFVLASSVSTTAANVALNSVSGLRKSATQSDEAELVGSLASVSVKAPGESASEVKKSVLSRNIFNSSGELPPEAEAGAPGITKTKDLNFDAVPCTEGTIPVEIVGTIFTGDPKKSFVSLKDPKIEDTDIYKPGDLIIDNEDFEIYQVQRGTLEVRKGDQKICIDLKGLAKNNASDSGAGAAPAVAKPENTKTIEFDQAFVNQEIGPGYANILNAAKMIPDVDASGKTTGFKLIAITPGSIFDKMEMQNGDIVADVNGVSLRDASQGFKLYQALQEEREITIGIIRNGQPMTTKVRVK